MSINLSPGRSVRQTLADERAKYAKVFRALQQEGKSRYLPMRELGALLYWRHERSEVSRMEFPGWVIYRDGEPVVHQILWTWHDSDVALFVDAVVACGGLDLDQCWFDEELPA